MSLAAVVDALAARLDPLLTATVTDALPAAPVDLPAVTLSVPEADQELVGVGRVPRGPRTGALEVTSTVDLADPVLTIGDESIDLLSPDRLTLLLPHGPIVRADGTEGPPFGAADLEVSDDDGLYEVVNAPPGGRRVQLDPVQAELTFGQPLPATGTLTANYRIGQWDVTVARHTGSVDLTLTTSGAGATVALSRQVATELDRRDDAFEQLVPTGWGAAEPVAVGTVTAHRQSLRYRFSFELETPLLPPGGGVIRTVAVTSLAESADATDATELFEVTHEP